MYDIIPGMMANVALLANLFFTLGILASFQSALTMPLVEPAVLGHLLLIDDAGQEDGGEERAAQTDDPRGGETTDRTRSFAIRGLSQSIDFTGGRVTSRMIPVMSEVRLESKMAEKAFL